MIKRSKDRARHSKLINSKAPGPDKVILFLSLLLTVLGLIAVTDASAPQAVQKFADQYYFLKQQIVWAVIGVALMFIVSRVHYRFWEKIATYLFAGSLLLLILVLIPGIGIKILGARRWIDLGFFSFQPSEFIKLGLAVYIAKVASKDKKALAFLVPVIITAALIMLQPDLGTTMVVSVAVLAQIFVSGLNLLYFLASGVIGLGSFLFLTLISDYRRDRLVTFLNQTDDPLNKGYHIRQILLALGSGGLFGVGLGESRQKYLFLPETATDSIFAIIAEEVGFIGAMVLILLFVFYIIKGVQIAKRAPDKFSAILAVGIVSWVAFQVIFNIGSMVALVPLTGIPLPFISAGGSSLVTILIATGILLNISKNGK